MDLFFQQMSSMGFKSGLLDHSQSSILAWFSHSFSTFDVFWDHCPTGIPNCPQHSIFWRMSFSFPEEMILLLSYSTFFLWGTRPTAPQHNSIPTMLHSRCGVLGVKGLIFCPPNILLVNNYFFFCLIWPQGFPPEGFFFVHMMGRKLQSSFKMPRLEGFFLARQPLSSCWCKNTLDCGPSRLSNSLQTGFLVFFGWLWPVFPQQQVIVSVFFLVLAVTQLFHALYTYKQLSVQLMLGPVTALNRLHVTLLTCSNQWCALSDQCWAA